MKTFACALLLAVSTLAAEGAVELQLQNTVVESDTNLENRASIARHLPDSGDEDTEGDDSHDDHAGHSSHEKDDAISMVTSMGVVIAAAAAMTF